MNVRATLVLSFGLAILLHLDSLAQSEFLRYKETGLGVALSYARGDATERVYEASATVAFDGALDVTGAMGWSWVANGQSPGFDVKTYGAVVAYHPRKPNHDTGIQAKLSVGYASVSLRGNYYTLGYDTDNSRTAAFAEGGLYIASDHTTRFALVPAVAIGRTFMNVGGSGTYYTAGMAGMYRKRNGAVYARIDLTATSGETLLGIAVGLLGSLGHGWK